jgi:hypothetical protein
MSRFSRQCTFERSPDLAAPEDRADLTLAMAFASDTPYERWWGIEILDCSPRIRPPGSPQRRRRAALQPPTRCPSRPPRPRLRRRRRPCRARQCRCRLGCRRRPHDRPDRRRSPRQGLVGYEIHAVIEQSTTKDGKSIERKLDGQHCSAGCSSRCQRDTPGDLAVFRRALDSVAGPLERAADTPTTYRVIDWEPLENSLVTVPADASVGIGRMADDEPATPPAAPAAPATLTPLEHKRMDK